MTHGRLPGPRVRCTVNVPKVQTVVESHLGNSSESPVPHNKCSAWMKKPKKSLLDYVTCFFQTYLPRTFFTYDESYGDPDSPRVGYALEASSVKGGLVGPRSLIHRYDKDVHIRQVDVITVERLVFQQKKDQETFNPRPNMFLGLFQTFQSVRPPQEQDKVTQPKLFLTTLVNTLDVPCSTWTVSDASSELFSVSVDDLYIPPTKPDRLGQWPETSTVSSSRSLKDVCEEATQDASIIYVLSSLWSFQNVPPSLDFLFDTLQESRKSFHETFTLSQALRDACGHPLHDDTAMSWSCVFLPALIP